MREEIGRKTLQPRKLIPLPSLNGIGLETLQAPEMERAPSRLEYDANQAQNLDAANERFRRQEDTVSRGINAEGLIDPNAVQASTQDVPQAPPPLSPYEQQLGKYNDAIASKPQKQGALAQAAWWALNGVNRIFNPELNKDPVQWLGEAKRENRIQREGAVLAPLRAEEQFKQQQIGIQQKQRMDSLEYQLKMNKGLQDAFNNDPDVLLIKESKRVTPDQAQRLNAKYNTQYTPAFWGSFVEKEVEGQSYIRPSDRPNYAPNASLATDRTESTVATPLSGGGVGYVPSKQAVTLDNAERVAGITAGRQVAIKNADLQAGAQQRNIKALNDYSNDVVRFGNTVAQKMAELGDTAGANEINTLTEQANAINAKYTTASDEEEADKYKAEMDKVNAKLTAVFDKQARNQAVQLALKGMKPPIKPKLEKPVQVDVSSSGKPFAQPQGGTTNKTTLEAATQHYKSKGLTGSALRIAIANARRMGMIE